MSDLAQTATTIWAALIGALRQDGLIATGVTAPGPHTSQVLLQMAHDNCAKDGHVVWTPAEIVAAPTAVLWTRHFDYPEMPGQVVAYSEAHGSWINVHTLRRPEKFTHYILLPDIGKPLQLYTPPAEKPEPELMDP